MEPEELVKCKVCHHPANDHDDGGCRHACTCRNEFLGATTWEMWVETMRIGTVEMFDLNCTCGWRMRRTYDDEELGRFKNWHNGTHELIQNQRERAGA